MDSAQSTGRTRFIPRAPSMQWVDDEDLLPYEMLERLSEPARRLFRNISIWMLRKGHTRIHLSDAAAAAMAGCAWVQLADVRNELIAWNLLDFRHTHRRPRYTLLNL